MQDALSATTIDQPSQAPSFLDQLWSRWVPISLLVAATIVAVVAIARAGGLQNSAVAVWNWVNGLGSARTLRWLAAVLPGCIILNHVVYLLSSRRKQFRQALAHLKSTELAELENLYFGSTALTIRYVIPAILVTVLSAAAIAALSNPGCYLTWLYVPLTPSNQQSTSAQVNPPDFATICTSESSTTAVSPTWPSGWAGQVLSGAALGFIGAYVYLLILLTDRARQRDVTTGIAVWAAAMPVLGPLMGGVAALLIVSGTSSQQGSFTQYAVFFVAGMLPRQFALFVQSGVSKMFQTGSQVQLRTLPLTMLRGIGPDVAARLEEEGIYDVSALAYASPHQLIRATTYAPRQIADWIDEALMIATVPSHWEALEKVGVTGAMDLAWYQTSQESIKALADEIKLGEPLLKDIVARLWQDAQVQDLYKLYWDQSGPPPSVRNQQQTQVQRPTDSPEASSLQYTFKPGIVQDARERLIPEIKQIPGVHTAGLDGDRVILAVDPGQRDTIDTQLRLKPEFQDPSH